MARHNEILNKFKDILADGFSFENEVHKSMVRQLSLWHLYFLMWEKISTTFRKSKRSEPNSFLHLLYLSDWTLFPTTYIGCVFLFLVYEYLSKGVLVVCQKENIPYFTLIFILLQLMQIMIKVSDVSNEARPMEVAEPWLDCLLQEFFIQVNYILSFRFYT